MKRITQRTLSLWLVMAFLLSFLPLPAAAEPAVAELPPVRLWIHGSFVQTDVDPLIENSRTLVPLRVISENLGVPVEWVQESQQVILHHQESPITFTLNEPSYVQNGEIHALDVAPKLFADRTMVPLRAIAEVFAQPVDWDNDGRVAIVGEGYVPANPLEQVFESAQVVSVVDGDTLIVDRGHGAERLRLILVDTPETVHPNKGVQPFGPEASAYTTNALTGRTVYLEKDVSETDRYQRLLRYVWLERPSSATPTVDEMRTKLFNAQLLLAGMATVAVFPPDVKYRDTFDTFAEEARLANAGLWSLGTSSADTPSPSPAPSEPGGIAPAVQDRQPAWQQADGRIIANTNSMIYHLPGGRDYRKVLAKNALFFHTEAEAQAAGFRRAQQ